MIRTLRWSPFAPLRAASASRMPLPRRHLATAAVEDDFEDGIPPPLEGIKVLDFSSALSGPSATQYLGDLGADIWKLEVPGKGDDTRHWGPPLIKHLEGSPPHSSPRDYETSFFAVINRNKRSLTVNCKKPEGFEVAFALAQKADVIVENLITGKLSQMGLGYEAIKAVNPGIIYVSITGYGQTGPWATAPGYDAILAGEGGVIHCTGEADQLPVRPQVALSDHAAGFNAYGAVMAALLKRNRTGKGCHIDVSMFDCQVAALGHASSQYLNLGIEYERLDTASSLAAPDQIFKTRDSSLALSIFKNSEWMSFLDAADLKHLNDDTRFSIPETRQSNREALASILQDVFRQKDTKDWFARLENKGFAIAPVRNVEGTFNHPLVKEQNLVSDLPHSHVGSMRLVNPPVLYNGRPMPTRHVPPMMGSSTNDILKEELGLNASEVDELRSSGAC